MLGLHFRHMGRSKTSQEWYLETLTGSYSGDTYGDCGDWPVEGLDWILSFDIRSWQFSYLHYLALCSHYLPETIHQVRCD